MKTLRSVSLLAPLLWLAYTVQGCAGVPATHQPHADTVSRLTRQAHDWDAAIIAKDMSAVATNMAPDYRHIRDNGQVSDGAAFLAFIGSPKLVIHPYKVNDLEVRLYGDTALLSGTTRMSGSYDGTPFTTHYRYIDVYVRRGGKWQVASVQITPMPD
jgi:ketosteroid isomerase-like protein